ncbi:hypothetical protein ncot_01095 [Nocardioides sp. JQ2195]|uniref:hypothetical protein n=1 Tax=Nocardioides sp. JQ2195 TaxID=2592334 RepID=UPI00143E826F|nr:hypothetical protein [Nocardioides sp. JQ2195]QIX25337.1 hypothetical protein ncot_01095 [Nocardioides sp. JQ2195]
MGRKKKILLHIGPKSPEPTGPPFGVHTGLAAEQSLLDGVELLVADVEQPDLDRAAHEMLRTHKSVGLRRREVDGAWAGTCRSLLRCRSDLVLSQPGFATANDEQAALVIDGLAGLDVHVVITPTEGEDPEALRARWSAHLRAGRVHIAPLSHDAAFVDLAEELAGLALCIRKADPGGHVTKFTRRRPTRAGSRMVLREAS